MQGAEERRLRRMSNTPQGGAIEGNAADDALMVDQGPPFFLIQRPCSAMIAGGFAAAPLFPKGRPDAALL